MPATARDLLIAKKIERLPPARVAEVEDFVDFLVSRDSDRQLAHAVTAAAVPAFAKVWKRKNLTIFPLLGVARKTVYSARQWPIRAWAVLD